jgi:hypothetical protein
MPTRRLSWGSWLLQHLRPVRVHCPRVCLTRSVPPSGFLTLLTACSSYRLPGLVACRSALGVPRPSEPSSSTRSRATSRRPPCPPAVRLHRDTPARKRASGGLRSRFPSGVRRASRMRRGPATGRVSSASVPVRLQGLAPRAESVPRPPVISRPSVTLLSWASGPLQGSPPRSRAPMSPPALLPRACSSRAPTRPCGRTVDPAFTAPRSLHASQAGRIPKDVADPPEVLPPRLLPRQLGS